MTMRKHPGQLNLLARHRMAQGMTQKELAYQLKVRPSTVCAWEAGQYRPDPKRIPKLAELLDLDALRVAEFFDGEAA